MCKNEIEKDKSCDSELCKLTCEETCGFGCSMDDRSNMKCNLYCLKEYPGDMFSSK